MKFLFDRVGAFVLILLFLPIYIIVSLLILLKMGSPILFRQLRPGYKEKIFVIYKFRTMTNEKDEHGELLTQLHHFPTQKFKISQISRQYM